VPGPPSTPRESSRSGVAGVGDMNEIGGGVVSRFTYTAEDVLRAAGALWESRNPDTDLWSVEESERQDAWAKAAADAELVLKAAGGELTQLRAVKS
jgi:hypothetical protein